MQTTTKKGRVIEIPSDEEDAAINEGIAADPDNPEWAEKNFANALSFDELTAEVAQRTRGIQKSPTKTPISIRLDQDVIDYFKAGGKGWQARVNQALRESAHLSPNND